MDEIKDPTKIDWFGYELTTPVHYSDGGSRVPATSITICAPPESALIRAFKVEQMISGALLRASTLFSAMQKAEPDQKMLEGGEDGISAKAKTPKDEGETIRFILKASDLDLEMAIKAFARIAMEGCVKVNGKNINFMQWSEISQSDQMEIFFQFAGVFVMSSPL